MSVRVTLIAAVSRDGFISRDGGIPWDLPADRAHFRASTKDQWLLFGRKTYLEMDGWFRPGHHALVLSRSLAPIPPPGRLVASVSAVLAIAEASNVNELFVCGGAHVYKECLSLAHRLLMTRVHVDLISGIPFPPIDALEWKLGEIRNHPADRENVHAMDFVELFRRTGGLDE
jgi:dihydrofolate reductase